MARPIRIDCEPQHDHRRCVDIELSWRRRPHDSIRRESGFGLCRQIEYHVRCGFQAGCKRYWWRSTRSVQPVRHCSPKMDAINSHPIPSDGCKGHLSRVCCLVMTCRLRRGRPPVLGLAHHGTPRAAEMNRLSASAQARAENRLPFPFVELLVTSPECFFVNTPESKIAAQLGGFMKNSNKFRQTSQPNVTRLGTRMAAKRACNLGSLDRVRLDRQCRSERQT